MSDTLHKELLLALKKHAGHGTKHSGNVAYTGSSHFSYHISNPIRRGIARNFLAHHKNVSKKGVVALLNRLYRGKSHEEKSIAGMFLGYSKEHRKQIQPRLLDEWLDHLEGWAEVDSLSQSNFGADEMLSGWEAWKRTLTRFSKGKNINKQRASLVLLTKPVRESRDRRLSTLAFKNIGRLQQEKDIMITKAISWLLRSLIENHKREVMNYIQENNSLLPKIAVRETKRKLIMGRK